MEVTTEGEGKLRRSRSVVPEVEGRDIWLEEVFVVVVISDRMEKKAFFSEMLSK